MKTSDLGMTLNGVRLHIKGSELVEHFKTRAQYHGNRAELYQSKMKEIEELRKTGDELANKSISKGSQTTDPLDSLEASFKDHQAKFRFFSFASTHMVEDLTYVCDLPDLINYELAARNMRMY